MPASTPRVRKRKRVNQKAKVFTEEGNWEVFEESKLLENEKGFGARFLQKIVCLILELFVITVVF